MKKNILIIDDSALMRRVISDIINTDSRFVVADLAVNGLEAFKMIVDYPSKYDAVILDINMPKMNGLELLEQLNRNHIKIMVIIVSTVAKEGARETIQALELGAFDFVTKPDSFIEARSEKFRDSILECLSIALKVDSNKIPLSVSGNGRKKAEFPLRNQELVSIPSAMRKQNRKVLGKGAKKLVALACSTGGPKALQSVIPYLPSDLDAPMLVVQHMPQGFTNSLAMRLDEMSKLKVKEAENGETLCKGTVYIAKGGSQMRVLSQPGREYKLSITSEPARNGLKPCADIMYESLCNCSFDEITCVVLTGMGADGTKGIQQLNNHNKIYVIAQDEKSSVVYGMPKVIAEAGLADEIKTLKDIADAITKNVGVL